MPAPHPNCVALVAFQYFLFTLLWKLLMTLNLPENDSKEKQNILLSTLDVQAFLFYVVHVIAI